MKINQPVKYREIRIERIDNSDDFSKMIFKIKKCKREELKIKDKTSNYIFFLSKKATKI